MFPNYFQLSSFYLSKPKLNSSLDSFIGFPFVSLDWISFNLIRLVYDLIY